MRKKGVLFLVSFIISFVTLSQTNSGKKISAYIKCPSVSNDLKLAFNKNIFEINTTDSVEDFKNFNFLKKIIGNKRFVLLGESSQGVEEYSMIKERLIKFLHQEMGFEVILFESDLFDCNTSYMICDSFNTAEFMKNSIYNAWHTDINLKLFKYIKEKKNSDNPLFLSGFDIKTGINKVTANYKLYDYYKKYFSTEGFIEFVTLDSITNNYFRNVILYGREKDFNDSLSSSLFNRYNKLLNHINKNTEDINKKIIERVIYNKKCLINIINTAKNDPVKYYAMRGKCMAENIEWIAGNLFPDKKIIVWAHNKHIRRNMDHRKNIPTMGFLLSEEIKEQSYIIGLYGLKGSLARGDRSVYNANYLRKNSLEAIICNTDYEISFIDFTKKYSIDPNKQFFLCKEKKTISQVKQSYDGLLFIRNISPPNYINN
ncbi:MAG: erythromycin esterase family protein [Bacteroidales bacterium]|nr:erythromycin esterase family protein [Bacteroidales bacterium]